MRCCGTLGLVTLVWASGCACVASTNDGSATDTTVVDAGTSATDATDVAVLDARLATADANSVADAAALSLGGSGVSLARTPDSVLVAYADEMRNAYLVALRFDGTPYGPPQSVLTRLFDEVIGTARPYVAWGPAGGLVIGHAQSAGIGGACAAQRVDARAQPVAAPSVVSIGYPNCGVPLASTNGWTIVTSLVSSDLDVPLGLVSLDAATVPTTLSSTLPDFSRRILAIDRTSSADEGFLLAWWTYDAMDDFVAFARPFDATGAPIAPAAPLGMVPRASDYEDEIHIAGSDGNFAVAWLAPDLAVPTTRRGYLQVVDPSGVALGTAASFGAGGQPNDFEIQLIHGHWLIVWTELVSASLQRMLVQVRALDGTAAAPPVELTSALGIFPPEMVETPTGALIVYSTVNREDGIVRSSGLLAQPFSMP